MVLCHATAGHLKGSKNLSDSRRNILGQKGEELAAAYLLNAGYRILERNYRNHYGEIDIIAWSLAQKTKTLVFVEVKTRKNSLFSHPSEAVTRKKQIQISKVALEYLAKNNLTEIAARFDVVAIILPDNGPPQIDLIPNAFDLSAGF
jgi:putative endonuclease